MTDSATGVAEGSISKNEQKRQLKVFIIIIFAVVFFAATQIEKSTTDINKRGLQPRWMKNKSASSEVQVARQPKDKPVVCNLEEGCESCQ